MSSPASAVAGVVPRWEWRTFGADADAAARHLAALTPDRVQDSDEVYLLARDRDASVKVRDELMDVKRLEHVDEHGLQQWRPVAKVAAPLAAHDVRVLMDGLEADVPPLARETYTFAQLRDEVIAPSPDLLVIAVHKHREHYAFAGCMAEVSEIVTDRGAVRTVAVESEDPDGVVAAVHELGLDPRLNVSLPQALKRLAGLASPRYAVIDVGTNSVKFHVGEHHADGGWVTVVDRAEVTRLGEGLDAGGGLGDEPMRRTADAIAAMAADARRAEVDAIAAVATAGVRTAANRDAFLALVRERAGLELEVLSGDEEARLAYVAATSALPADAGTRVVFDTGGGSSQFTFGRGEEVEERFSVDVGAVRFTERFGLDGPADDDTLRAALDAIAADLSPLDGRAAPEHVVGLGGAITNLTAVKLGLSVYDPGAVQGAVLTRADVDAQIERYRAVGADERRAIVGLQPARAEVILAGACIVGTVLGKLGADTLTVSDRGLRHGLLAERFGR